MNVIVVASQKGGSGKTTAARNLAVACGPETALIDTDPQGTLTSWWDRRAAPTPILVRMEDGIANTLDVLRRSSVKVVFIDTPPSAHQFVADVMALADFVLVPVRPTPDDLDAVGPTLDMIHDAGCNFCFLLSQAKGRTRLVTDTIPALAEHGKVCPTIIHDRVEYPTTAISGLGVIETGNGAAAAEVRGVLDYVLRQIAPRSARSAKR